MESNNLLEIFQKKIDFLNQEMQQLLSEKEKISKRNSEIEVRMHQIVGAMYEIHSVINQVNQPSLEAQDLDGLE